MKVITIPLSKRGKHAGKYEAIVSAEDADLAEMWWAIMNTHKRTQYAIHRTGGRKKAKTIWLHRVVIERMIGRPLEPDEDVDHINSSGLDCRRENLRLATRSQNNANHRRRSDNKSGYKGVYWDKYKRRYRATIHIQGKKLHLGDFTDPVAAHRAYCEAAERYFGEFARFI